MKASHIDDFWGQMRRKKGNVVIMEEEDQISQVLADIQWIPSILIFLPVIPQSHEELEPR